VGPLAALGQQEGKLWRIGFLHLGSRQSAVESGRYGAFLEGMRELDYVERKHFVVEARFADGKSERLPGLAAELVRLKVDVIVGATALVHRALRKATTTIPIVMAGAPDPVADGFAASLARPGGNFTGMSTITRDLAPKRLELLVAAVPDLSRVAVLRNPTSPNHSAQLKSLIETARKFGIQIVPVDGGTPEDVERGFAMMARERAGAVIVLGGTLFVQHSKQIADLAIKHRLPSLFGLHDYVRSGGFMSYGADILSDHRRAAYYVDRILKGAKPGDLPIEQPTKFELVINMKTAKAIGITIPSSVLVRADRVIE
jgi:putative ABC transport system substrate-binding protein